MIICLCTLFISSISISLIIGFIIGLIYSKYYYDKSENDGSRKWVYFQYILSKIFYMIQKYYFTFNIIYKGDDDLESIIKQYQSIHLYDNEEETINDINSNCDFDDDIIVDNCLLSMNTTTTTLKNNNINRQRVIFSGHPHGLFPISSFFLISVPQYSNDKTLWNEVTPCIHKHIFAIPILRDIALWMGAINVTKYNIINMLKTRSVYIAPGGCREMILTNNDNDNIQKKHTGFLKIAYQTHTPIIPIIHIGQDKVFKSYSLKWIDYIRNLILDITGYPWPTIFIGPFPSKLTTYIFDLHNPNDYTDENKFINDYYAKLDVYYTQIDSK